MEQEIKIINETTFDKIDAIKILFGRKVRLTQYVTVSQEQPIDDYIAIAKVEVIPNSRIKVEQDKPTYGYITTIDD